MSFLGSFARPASPRVGKPRRAPLSLSFALAAALACGSAPAAAQTPPAATPRAELCRADLAAAPAVAARWSMPERETAAPPIGAPPRSAA